jgi:hypothetical protein
MNGISLLPQGTEVKRCVYHPRIFSQASDGIQIVWEHILLGSTQTILGVYQIIAALQVLGRWCNDMYRPWFKTHVMGMS